MKISFPLFAFAMLILLSSCGDSGNNFLSSGTHCYSWNEASASSYITLDVSSDGSVNGFQQGMLKDESGDITSSFQVVIEGTIDSNQILVHLFKDFDGSINETKETWTVDEIGLKTRKLQHTPASCSDLEFLPESKAVQLQGTWKSTGGGTGIKIKGAQFADILSDNEDNLVFMGYSMMDSCQKHLNADGKYLVLANGLCIRVEELTDDKLVLKYPALDPLEFNKVD